MNKISESIGAEILTLARSMILSESRERFFKCSMFADSCSSKVAACAPDESLERSFEGD
jgi:hypothetical protein